MLDFERKFRYGLTLLVMAHLSITCLSLFLFESLIPKEQQLNDKRIIARTQVDKLLVNLSVRRDMSAEDWQKQWTEKLDAFRQELNEAELDVSPVKNLFLVNPKVLWEDEKALAEAYDSLFAMGLKIDESWYKTLERYQKRALGGSWALVLVSILGLVCYGYFYALVYKHVLGPLLEIVGSLEDWKAGNRMRRCLLPYYGNDLVKTSHVLNEMLDQCDV